MLKVTDDAAALLWEAQRDEQACGMTFRLVEERGGFGLAFDTPTTDDLLFTRQGCGILCVSPTTVERASDLIIDLEETPEGRGLIFSVSRG